MSTRRKVVRKDGRILNNPFPGEPRGLEFIKGTLLCGLRSQSYDLGSSFLLKWDEKNGGSISISHCSEPNRDVFSTVCGVGFVYSALSPSPLIEECRGSVAIHDNVKHVCRHQTIENITSINDPCKEISIMEVLIDGELKETNLEKLKLEKPHLEKSIFEKTILGKLKLEENILEKSNFEKTILGKLKLEENILEKSNFDKTILEKSNLEETILEKSNFDKTILEKPQLEETILEKSNFNKTISEKFNLEETILQNLKIDKTLIGNAPIEKNHLEKSQFERYHLAKSQFDKTFLGKSQSDKTILEASEFDNIILGKSQFDKTKLGKVQLNLENGPIIGPVVVISGTLYSCRRFAIEQYEEFLDQERIILESEKVLSSSILENNSSCSCCLPGFCKTRPIGIHYRVVFVQVNDHEVRFIVHLEEPKVYRVKSSNSSHKDRCDIISNRKYLAWNKVRSGNNHVYNNPKSKNGSVMHFSMLVKKNVLKLRKLLKSRSNMYRRLKDVQRFNIVVLTISSDKDERFYGFGEQFSYMNMKGRRVPIFVQEQGIGRGDQPITALANLVSYRSGGDWSTTYAPSPFYMTSTMKSLYLEGHDYSIFDLRKDDRLQVQVHSCSMKGRILHGCSPVELIEHYTENIGRMRELPEWILSGAIVGMQGGTAYVRNIWKQLKKYDVPLSAFWLQDWVGQRKTSIGSQLWWNWEVDDSHYPEWRQLVKDLYSSGILTMAYCNPCLVPTHEKANRKRSYFDEANKLGLFARNKDGSTYIIPNTTFDVGMLDLTNPIACDWFKGILHDMVDTGVRGWMADFGEGLPLDAQLFSGEDAISAHNKYPEQWAKLNREFVDEWEAKQNKESETVSDRISNEKLVFFTRAGFRESPRWATLFWEGDQMVSWQRNDGIKSSIIGLLSSGLSGYALNHSDIGGYCTVGFSLSPYKRSEELLMRWMELNAFTTIFRTHEGNAPAENKQFYSHHRTLAHFARFAKVYKAWKFYRIQLVKEAATKGLPVVRHMFIHYPNDRHVQMFTYEQFLVGAELLVVPVVDPGKKEVKAYFPAGDIWKHVWTGHTYGTSMTGGKGTEAIINAPLGYPAVFIKNGSDIGSTFLQNLTYLNIV